MNLGSPQQLFLRKMIMSAFSGAMHVLSWLIVSPAVENIRFAGVAEAWAHV